MNLKKCSYTKKLNINRIFVEDNILYVASNNPRYCSQSSFDWLIDDIPQKMNIDKHIHRKLSKKDLYETDIHYIHNIIVVQPNEQMW